MATKKRDFNFWLNMFILVGMTIAVIIANIVKAEGGDTHLLKMIIITFGAVMGVINTVLSANGNIWTFFFGIIDVTICAYANLDGGNVGVFAQHIIYFLPMQFVGLWQWRKRGAGKKTEDGGSTKVQARRLTPKQWGYLVASFVLGTAICYAVLYFVDVHRFNMGQIDQVDKAKIFLDSSVVMLNTLGQVLMSLAFAEQWYLWNLVNIFSILLWLNRLATVDQAPIMLIKYSFYLLNSLNGLRIWLHLSKHHCDSDAPVHKGCC